VSTVEESPDQPVSMRLEVVVIPVSDVDRALAFHRQLGWRLDADLTGEPGFRVVQLTPPGHLR
jgi:catechol 2,3-dioxygenase-like lactoylglutathione lyase family enzyme